MSNSQRTARASTPPDDGPPRLLVIDDDDASRRLLSQSLRNRGYEVEKCASGEEALRHLESYPTDLLVLDFEMPEMNGAEVCTRLRAHEREDLRELPIILLTGHAGENEEVACFNAGANDFVTKPVSIAVLEARIRTQLRLRALNSELQNRNLELERWRRDQEADLLAAQRTQQAIVPARLPSPPGWEVASLYTPLIQVGGDMFGWRPLDEGRWLFWLADATGHGAAAALYTAFAALLFHHAAAGPAGSAADILRRVNEEFFAVFRHGSFMSACCLVAEPNGGVTFASAGHPPLLIWHSTGEPELVPATASLLGIAPRLEVEEVSCQLRPHETALIYTDGLYSLIDQQNERMLPAHLTKHRPNAGSAAAFLQELRDKVIADSNGEPFTDDVSAIALRRMPGPGSKATAPVS